MKMKRLLTYLLSLSGLGILFFPFLNDSILANRFTSGYVSVVYTINYIEYLKGMYESIFYHLRYPYLEIIDLLIVFLIPISLLIQIISSYINNYKLINISIIFCLLSLIYFTYFNRESLRFGVLVMIIQQITLFSFIHFFILKKLNLDSSGNISS